MLDFLKKNKKDTVNLTEQILNQRVALNQLKKKLGAMLQSEITVAKRLKEQGMKSPSNYMKIGLYYKMIGLVNDSYTRLDEIQSGDELNRITGDLASVMSVLNSMSSSTTDMANKGLKKQYDLLGKKSDEARKSMGDLFKSLDTAASSANKEIKFNESEESFIESLINGGGIASDMPGDAIPLGNRKKNTVDEDMDFQKIDFNALTDATAEDEKTDIDLGDIFNSL